MADVPVCQAIPLPSASTPSSMPPLCFPPCPYHCFLLPARHTPLPGGRRPPRGAFGCPDFRSEACARSAVPLLAAGGERWLAEA